MSLFWLISERGTEVPFIDDYKFVLNGSNRKPTKYWKCCNNSCTVTATTLGLDLVRVKNEHNHPATFEMKINGEFRLKIRNMIASDPFISAKRVYDASIIHFSESYLYSSDQLSALNTFDMCKGYIYNEKHKYYPAASTNSFNIVFDERFALTRSGSRFLQIDENITGRLMLFSDIEFCARFFQNNNDIKLSMDGTFKSSPSNFYQLYIIYGELYGQSFPLFYSFLENKTTEIYIRLLNHCKDLIHSAGFQLNPLSIVIDYEYGMYNAITLVFPNTIIRGCYFHFGQAIWRKMCFFGLKRLYNSDVNFLKVVELISAIPLIPIEEINTAWVYIKTLYPSRETDVLAFFEYFESTWLENNQSMFNRKIWSHFNNYEARTNNAAEGFNSRLSRRLNKTHPSIYEVLNILKQIQVVNELEVNCLILGNSPRRQKKIYRIAHQHILNSRERYLSGSLSLISLLKAMRKAIKLCLRN